MEVSSVNAAHCAVYISQ